MVNAECSQLPIVEFQHFDRMVRSTRLHQSNGTTFSPECGRKGWAGSAARDAPLESFEVSPSSSLGIEAARLKPHLVLIVCWCGAMGTKPKVGERQADASEGRQSGKDLRGQRVPRRGTTMELEALVPGKSRRRMGSRQSVEEKKCPIRIWQCGRNKEVGRFRASPNG